MYDSKSITVPTDIHYIAIDSRYRDTSKHPSASSYLVNFDTVYKNVVSVELVHAIYDRPSGAVGMKYISLFVDELSQNVTTNNEFMKGAFTQLPITESSMGRSLVYERNLYRSIKMFDKPLSKLGRLTLRFVGFDGLDFPISEHYLRFEVTCMKTAAIPEWRNLDVVSSGINLFKSATGDLSDARKVLGVGDAFTEDELKRAFVRKAKLYKNNDRARYDECKSAFKELFNLLN